MLKNFKKDEKGRKSSWKMLFFSRWSFYSVIVKNWWNWRVSQMSVEKMPLYEGSGIYFIQKYW